MHNNTFIIDIPYYVSEYFAAVEQNRSVLKPHYTNYFVNGYNVNSGSVVNMMFNNDFMEDHFLPFQELYDREYLNSKTIDYISRFNVNVLRCEGKKFGWDDSGEYEGEEEYEGVSYNMFQIGSPELFGLRKLHQYRITGEVDFSNYPIYKSDSVFYKLIFKYLYFMKNESIDFGKCRENFLEGRITTKDDNLLLKLFEMYLLLEIDQKLE